MADDVDTAVKKGKKVTKTCVIGDSRGMGGGPHGLGDPDCRELRKLEEDVIIPKMMRERMRTTHCKDVVKAFSDCGKANGLSIVFKCRDENRALWDCMTKWFFNEEFRSEIREEYLAQRAHYRRTGTPHPDAVKFNSRLEKQRENLRKMELKEEKLRQKQQRQKEQQRRDCDVTQT